MQSHRCRRQLSSASIYWSVKETNVSPRCCSPTCSNASLDWLAHDWRPAPGPTPADSHHAEVVLSPRKHSAYDTPGQVKPCDRQGVCWHPLKAEVIIVPKVWTRPRQLYGVIGWALFDGQVGGRPWSCKAKDEHQQSCTSTTNQWSSV